MTEAPKGTSWVMVRVEAAVTESVKLQLPESPSESESIPETVYVQRGPSVGAVTAPDEATER